MTARPAAPIRGKSYCPPLGAAALVGPKLPAIGLKQAALVPFGALPGLAKVAGLDIRGLMSFLASQGMR